MGWEEKYGKLVKKETIKEYNTQVIIVDDLKSEQVIVPIWKGIIEKNPQMIQPVVFLNLHMVVDEHYGEYRLHCYGATVLEDMLAEETCYFTLVFSPLPTLYHTILAVEAGMSRKDSRQKRKTFLSILGQYPMVQYLNVTPFSEAKILAAWERALEFSLRKLNYADSEWIGPGEVISTFKGSQRTLSWLIHDVRARIPSAFEKAKNLFPSLPSNMDEALEFLKVRYENIKEKPAELIQEFRGKKVQGLFVDAAGTLFSSDLKSINFDLRDRLAEENKTRWVYVWSGGDLKNVFESLNLCPAGLENIAILPKQAFKGFVVEETIDDLPQDELEKEFGIRTLRHHQV